jgi:hypothetical protein
VMRASPIEAAGRPPISNHTGCSYAHYQLFASCRIDIQPLRFRTIHHAWKEGKSIYPHYCRRPCPLITAVYDYQATAEMIKAVQHCPSDSSFRWVHKEKKNQGTHFPFRPIFRAVACKSQ